MTAPDDDSLGSARLVAAGAGCFWLALGTALAFMALVAGAVAAPAFVILGPWAVAALALGVALLLRAPSSRTLVASTVLGLLSLALGVTALFGSTEDFQAGILVFIVSSAGAAAYSILALRRLPARPLRAQRDRPG